MQRLTLPPSQNTPLANRWFTTRRNTHIRKLYRLFYAVYTSLTPQAKNLGTLAPLLDHSTRGNLYELQDLCQNLFADGNPEEPYGFHFHWAVQALFNSSIKLQANLRMVTFHQQHQQQPGQNDPGHTAFIAAINEEIDNLNKSLGLLLDNGRDLLRLMLCEHTANDLLLRLIIEDEEMTHTLWNQSTLSLFTEMFPDQPEAGYMQAGKSYFMGQWLKEALQCYEISLNINNNLSEPRKQVSVIRAMLKDLGSLALRPQAP